MAQDKSEAGRKGGEQVSQDQEHLSEIGRNGGEAGQANRQPDQSQGRTGQQGGEPCDETKSAPPVASPRANPQQGQRAQRNGSGNE
jgi:general stress protein YciG